MPSDKQVPFPRRFGLPLIARSESPYGYRRGATKGKGHSAK